MIFCYPIESIGLSFSSQVQNLIIMQSYIFQRPKFLFSRVKPLLYLFAGQGTQEKGMLNELLQIDGAKRQIIKYSQTLGLDFIQINSTDSTNLINKTKVTQPLLVLSQVLRFKYLNPHGLIKEDYLVGHSVGEYSALCIANSISLQSCLKLVTRRGELMEQHTKQPSGMLIVRYSDQNKSKVLNIVSQSGLQIACYNTPNNVNIAGPLTKLQKARSMFRDNKITCLFLPVSAAFHCQMLTTMVQPFGTYLRTLTFSRPMARILRNLDGKQYEGDEDIKQGLLKHLTNPVQLQKCIRQVDPSTEWFQVGHTQTVRKYVEETRKKMK